MRQRYYLTHVVEWRLGREEDMAIILQIRESLKKHVCCSYQIDCLILDLLEARHTGRWQPRPTQLPPEGEGRNGREQLRRGPVRCGSRNLSEARPRQAGSFYMSGRGGAKPQRHPIFLFPFVIYIYWNYIHGDNHRACISRIFVTLTEPRN